MQSVLLFDALGSAGSFLTGLGLPSFDLGGGIGVFIAVILVVFLIFKLLKLSIKLFFKFLINALVGAVLLFIFNFVFASLLHLPQFYISINWLTAAVTGVLGVPGVIILLILQFIL